MEPNVVKIKFTLLLPLNYNDGTEVPRAIINRMCDDLYDLSDGFGLAGEVTGAYRMKDGSKKMDRSIIVWIGIFEFDEDILKRTIGKFAHELGQESLYLERSGGTIEFIPPLAPEDET